MAERNKYKDKPKEVVIDGVRVVEGSTDLEARQVCNVEESAPLVAKVYG